MRLKDRTWLMITLSAMMVLFAFALLTGCGKPLLPPVKETIENNTNTTVNHTDKKEIDRSKAVADSLKIVIAKISTDKKECDSVCQKALDQLLEQINHQKVSGKNSYGFLWDKHKRLLTAYANLAETVNQKTVITKDSIVYRDKLIKKEIPVTIKYTPWYYKYPAYFGWACFLLLCGYLLSKFKSWTQKKFLS